MQHLRMFILLAAAGAAHAGKSADECAQEVGDRATPGAQQSAIAACLLEASGQGTGPHPEWKALSPDNNGALRFAKVNAGKYKQEVPTAISKPLSVRARMGGHKLLRMSSYDAGAERLSFWTNLAKMREFEFFSSCRPSGSFVGQNAFGAKTRVQVESCEKASIMTPEYPGVPLDNGLNLTPAQYRALQSNGADVEVDFHVASNSQGVIAYEAEMVQEATIREPFESRITHWYVYGEIQQIRVVVPGGSKAVIFSK